MNLKITLKRSKIGRTERQKATLACLGLRKINQSRTFKENPALLGQINKVKHLIAVETVKTAQTVKKSVSSPIKKSVSPPIKTAQTVKQSVSSPVKTAQTVKKSVSSPVKKVSVKKTTTTRGKK